MGFYARRPFAIAPYMGENAFIAVTVVQGMGFPWPTALGAIFIAGVAFTLLTVFRVRGWLASAIPASLKHSFAVGIGLFLAFIGLNEAGIVVAGGPGHPVALGAMNQPGPLLAVFGFLLTVWLLARRVPGALLAGILTTTALVDARGRDAGAAGVGRGTPQPRAGVRQARRAGAPSLPARCPSCSSSS